MGCVQPIAPLPMLVLPDAFLISLLVLYTPAQPLPLKDNFISAAVSANLSILSSTAVSVHSAWRRSLVVSHMNSLSGTQGNLAADSESWTGPSF